MKQTKLLIVFALLISNALLADCKEGIDACDLRVSVREDQISVLNTSLKQCREDRKDCVEQIRGTHTFIGIPTGVWVGGAFLGGFLTGVILSATTPKR